MQYNILVVSKDDKKFSFIEDVLSNSELDIERYFADTKEKVFDFISNDGMSLIIIDSEFENNDNINFTKEIKENKFFLDKPILLLVPSLQYGLEREDVSDFIIYPSSKDKFSADITNILNRYYQQQMLINQMFSDKKEHKEEISLLKDRMLIIFAHELKTPLNAIINFSDYINKGLQKKLTRAKVDKFIELSEIIKINGEVLLNEINTLLDIAKIKDHCMVFNEEELDLKGIIDHILHNYKFLYDKNVNSNISFIKVSGDKNSFVHIFENIYSNALKYTNNEVFVSLKEDKDKFYLIVEDDGDGIEIEERDKIFELFEQSDDTVLTREKEGTGIGLYIVKLLCDKFNYSIKVTDSKLGGAKFCISGLKNKGLI